MIKMKLLPLFFLLIFTIGLAQAGDEVEINKMLKTNYVAGFYKKYVLKIDIG
jgi:hypothetical protein